MKAYSIIITCVLLLFILFPKSSIKPKGLGLVVLKDTIYTIKPVLKPTEPVITYIYRHDTILREQVKDTTIVIGVEETRRKLEVTTIDTKSLVKTEEYHLPIWSKYRIDNTGAVKIKRKWLPRILVGTGILLTGIVIYKIKSDEKR